MMTVFSFFTASHRGNISLVLPGGASLHSVYGENSKSQFDILEHGLDSKRETSKIKNKYEALNMCAGEVAFPVNRRPLFP